MNVTVIAIVIGVLGTDPEGLVKGLEDLEINLGDHPNSSIIKISQNTKEGD